MSLSGEANPTRLGGGGQSLPTQVGFLVGMVVPAASGRGAGETMVFKTTWGEGTEHLGAGAGLQQPWPHQRVDGPDVDNGGPAGGEIAHKCAGASVSTGIFPNM